MSQTHLPPFWREKLLAGLGAPRTSENLRFLNAWAAAEGGVAQWNPLNTTWKLPGSTDYNSSGVQNFSRPQWGVYATGLTLTGPASGTLTYGRIVGHLQAGTYTAEQIVDDCADQIRVWGTNPDAIRAALTA